MKKGKNEFSTIYSAALVSRVVSPLADAVVDPCNIGLYLHSKNPYLHSISCTSCNNIYNQTLLFDLAPAFYHILTLCATLACQ